MYDYINILRDNLVKTEMYANTHLARNQIFCHTLIKI